MTEFRKLNDGWNADPNVPEPLVSVAFLEKSPTPEAKLQAWRSSLEFSGENVRVKPLVTDISHGKTKPV